jgi:WD40 repeat protein
MHPTRVLRSLLVFSAAGLLGLSSQSGVLASHSRPVRPPAILSPPGPIGWESRVPGDEVWVQHYNERHDFASSLGVSPDGTKVFVTGQSGGLSFRAYATIAYDASTGSPLWIQRYGELGDLNLATSLGISPDGSKVFVTGSSNGQVGTIAYDASSGAQLWVELYGAEGGATSVQVSPDGTKVFVTGGSEGDYATIAYDPSTGATLWVQVYDNGHARAVAVSPDGTEVFVTGTSGEDYATIAYDTSSGAELWVSRYGGWPGRQTQATSVGVSPNGAHVFVTGGIGRPNGTVYGTIAYDASTGSALWSSLYGGSLHCCSRHVARSLGVSSDGSKVFVTGESEKDPANVDYATVAYDASTGAGLWTQRFTRMVISRDTGTSIGVSPDGASVFVTGGSNGEFATISYDASSGALSWVSLYTGLGGGEARSIGLSPDATKVFVTGPIIGESANYDYATIAYSTR